MSQTAQVSKSTVIGGMSISSVQNREADNAAAFSPTIPVGTAGVLTTRTDNDTGTITAAGHGIPDTTVVDVYWAGGARYGMVTGSADTDTFVIDGGSGDNLPAQTTALVVSPRFNINIALDGDEAELVALKLETADLNSTLRGHVAFFDADDDEIAAMPLTANDVQLYDIGGGSDNPFTGDPITYARASVSSSTETGVLRIGVLQDSTP